MEEEVPDEDAEVVLGEVGDRLELLPGFLPAPVPPRELEQTPVEHHHVVGTLLALLARLRAAPDDADLVREEHERFVFREEEVLLRGDRPPLLRELLSRRGRLLPQIDPLLRARPDKPQRAPVAPLSGVELP